MTFPEHSSLGFLEKILAKFISDSNSSVLEIIDFEHAQVHDGKMFVFSHLFTGITQDSNADIFIQTGNNQQHIIIKSSTGGNSHVNLYEGITVTVSGSPVNIYNKNRNSSLFEDIVIFHTPTVTDLGTLIYSKFLGGGSTGQKVGSTLDTRDEWVLKTNSKYLIRITNKATSASDISISGETYQP